MRRQRTSRVAARGHRLQPRVPLRRRQGRLGLVRASARREGRQQHARLVASPVPTLRGACPTSSSLPSPNAWGTGGGSASSQTAKASSWVSSADRHCAQVRASARKTPCRSGRARSGRVRGRRWLRGGCATRSSPESWSRTLTASSPACSDARISNRRSDRAAPVQRALFLDRPLGSRKDLEALVRDRPTALD